ISSTRLTYSLDFFILDAPPPSQIYTLSLHDALPISSGSFKDNGMTAAFTHARMVDARRAACASTGNTSASLAVFCSATGLMRARSEEHTSELQSRVDLVCRLLLEKKNNLPEATPIIA